MSYSKNMTKKSKRTIHLGELPQAELEILKNQDPDVLATALIFVIGELIVQEYDIDQQPEIHKIVKEAAMRAIELVAGVHLTMEIDNRFPDTTERTIH